MNLFRQNLNRSTTVFSQYLTYCQFSNLNKMRIISLDLVTGYCHRLNVYELNKCIVIN